MVPLGALYSPLKQQCQTVGYDPVRCKNPTCQAVLNPYCQVDFNAKLWVCPFCGTYNNFPSNYAAHISPENLVPELLQTATTIEYTLTKRPPSAAPAFVWLVDRCLPEDELDALKETLQLMLDLVPEDCTVCLITFGTTVNVHDLKKGDCARTHIFQGTKHYDAKAVGSMLGLAAQGQADAARANQGFLLPVGQCQDTLAGLLEDMGPDPWEVSYGDRPKRCTGSALSVAAGLLANLMPNQGARIMLFLGGPCDVGPGMIVSEKLSETLRTHRDVAKNESNTRFMRDSTAYYHQMSTGLVEKGHTVDVFSCALDQVGLHEMKPLFESTGGLTVLCEMFSTPMFKQSLQYIFTKDPSTDTLNMAFQGTLECCASRECKIAGAIGHCLSMKKGSPSVSDSSHIGEAGTCQWYLGALNKTSTVSVFFDVHNDADNPVAQDKQRFLQFVTTYQHMSGQWRQRVTTNTHYFKDSLSNLPTLVGYFDQEAAAVLMAR